MTLEIAEQFNLPNELLFRAKAWSESKEFDQIFKACRQLATELEIQVDYAPVLESRYAYLAKLEHDTKRVIINGHELDRAQNPKQALEFLFAHEVFHYYCRKHPIPKEEELADLYAAASVYRRGF